MHMIDWQTVNGMSNGYKGWGCEDDDLYARLHRKDLLRNPKRSNSKIPEIVRPPKGKGVFVHLEVNETKTEDKNGTAIWKGDLNPNHENNARLLREMQQTNRNRCMYDGLNNVRFNVVGDELLRELKGTDGFFEIHHIKLQPQLKNDVQLM